jgi:molecular chaperone GrpE
MGYDNDRRSALEGRDLLEDRDSGGAPASEAPPRGPSDVVAPPEPGVGGPVDGDAAAADASSTPPLGDEQREAAVSTEPEVAAEEEAAEHQARVARDLEQLTAKAGKAQEYLELAQRTQADFENYRKRAARDAAAAQERGVVKLARELLPAVDDLDRALAAAEAASDGGNGAEMLASGIKLVHSGVLAALARVGIECYSPEGETFDPERHEAVAQQPAEGHEAGTIVEVYQRGYRLGDSVLRPAMVVVAG